MKRWCNNVDWSLESVLQNSNNVGYFDIELGWGPFSIRIFELGWGPFSNRE